MKKAQAKKIVNTFLEDSGINIWVEFLDGIESVALITNYWAMKFILSDATEILNALYAKGIFIPKEPGCWKIESNNLVKIQNSKWETICRISTQEQEKHKGLCVVQDSHLEYVKKDGIIHICYAGWHDDEKEQGDHFPIFLNGKYMELISIMEENSIVPFSAGETNPILLVDSRTKNFVGLVMPIKESGIRRTIQNLTAFL